MPAAWPVEQVVFLKENWGKKPIPRIANDLGRTVDAIKLKAGKLKLGRHLHAGDEITFCQLMTALGQINNYQQSKKSWINHELPVKYKKSIHKKFAVIKLADFWEWAELHKNLLDFSKLKVGALPDREPGWVDIKRQADIRARDKYKALPWTPEDDSYLLRLLAQHCYGYREIAERLDRTEGALKRRIYDLGVKERPVRADNHTPWKQQDVDTAKKLHFAGYTPDLIANHVGRSAMAVRGLIERLEAKGQLCPPSKPQFGYGGTHYRKVLPQEQWPTAELFLRMIATARNAAIKLRQKPIIDLDRIRDAFIAVESH
ncbi:MAG: hypothetical protein H6Q76_758 [Firmicutes bacterium]|nr:hypothetical protein [Bacillota bacterium]